MRTLPKIQAVLFTVILMVSIPVSAYGVDGQRKLTQPVPPASFPIVVNQSGSYVLTSNIALEDPNLNAIEITVNDVTLDLNGHTIQGSNSAGTGEGIYAYERYSITIKNGRVWGFGGEGIEVSVHPGNPSIEATGNWVDGIQAANNGDGGIRIYGGLVTNCTANNNSGTGISGYRSTITHCTANNNALEGIHGWGCSITNCTAHNSRNTYSTGISAYKATVINCTTNENFYGINANNSTVSNCTASENTIGIIADFSIIKNCTVSLNNGDGVQAGARNRIEESLVIDNGRAGWGYGIHLTSSENYVIKNLVSQNTNGNFMDDLGGNFMPLSGDNANYAP